VDASEVVEVAGGVTKVVNWMFSVVVVSVDTSLLEGVGGSLLVVEVFGETISVGVASVISIHGN
jgi:hypothetical protein